MKLTNDDFTSHVCDDANKDSDGLGWHLDIDITTEGKDELIRNQNLRELIEEEVEENRKFHSCKNVPDKPCCACIVQHELQKILKGSKK